MDNHSARRHATWAASATARNIVCAGAIAMNELIDAQENEAAAWGTACHQIAEACIREEYNAGASLNVAIKVGKFEFIVDEDMAFCAQDYVDYCADEVKKEPCKFWIEENFSLKALEPPYDAGGTGDFILYRPASWHLKVIDLKGGRGVVVEATGNPQMRTYAIGALLAHPELDVETVEVAIVQPRAPHKDGRIRTETFHVADLLEWTSDLLVHMRRSRAAYDAFQTLPPNSRLAFEAWSEAWLTTGQCTFCDAKSICVKYKREALATIPAKAKEWFEGTAEELPDVSNAPMLMSPEELAHALNGLDMLSDYIKALRERAHREAERGVQIPGWELAEKVGNRAYLEKDQAKLAKELKLVLNIGDEEIYERSIRSVAQLEKVLGSKRKAEFAKLEKKIWERPIKGTDLVRVSKTGRAPAASKPAKFFEAMEN
jgi:Protein of unknown function (DUF2800)